MLDVSVDPIMQQINRDVEDLIAAQRNENAGGGMGSFPPPPPMPDADDMEGNENENDNDVEVPEDNDHVSAVVAAFSLFLLFDHFNLLFLYLSFFLF